MKCLIYILLILTCQTILAQDTLLVPTQNVLDKYKCFKPLEHKKAILVKSKADAYSKLTKCSSQITPDTLAVDFTQNDLIFCNFNTGGVDEISCSLYKIPSQKKYILLINQKYKKAIAAVLQSHRLIYVTSKLDTTYTLELKEIETNTLTSQ
jgi:hypothetical protein